MDLIVLCLNPFHSPPASFFSQDRIIAEPEGLVQGAGSNYSAQAAEIMQVQVIFFPEDGVHMNIKHHVLVTGEKSIIFLSPSAPDKWYRRSIPAF